ncbi:hypothetical protein O7621_17100 [Solwaraspora sp. WMMD937]|nr:MULTISPECIES: hypothetical protein [unclassified Solwaraspora]WBB98882.1 hypothetical protein O7553_08375 [Solwaraspora sp. WMMA2059]WBC22565.1 hypothetical protein O7543_08990 [Solwaraspora sp. WMMA2080]WFE19643.1 hypothetical protein O7621_17100 [Solwaraspora sp. WMMD937]
MPVDVVYPVPGRQRYADRTVPPPDRRPATRTDRAQRRGGNAGRHYLR